MQCKTKAIVLLLAFLHLPMCDAVQYLEAAIRSPRAPVSVGGSAETSNETNTSKNLKEPSGMTAAAQVPSMPISSSEQARAEFTIGSTFLDFQDGEFSGDRIAVGCSGRIHNAWIFKPEASSGTGDQTVQFLSYVPGSPLGSPNFISDPGVVFTSSGVDDDGISLMSWEFASESIQSQVSKALECEDYGFNSIDFPDIVQPDTLALDKKVRKPRFVADKIDGQHLVHAIGFQRLQSSTTRYSLNYYRSTGNVTGWAQAVPKAQVRLISAKIVRYPHPYFQIIGFVYFKPRDLESPRINDNDIAYMESYDHGVTWSSRNVTNYQPNDLFRPVEDLDVSYDEYGALHVAWTEAAYDPDHDKLDPSLLKLRHWDRGEQVTTNIRNLVVEHWDELFYLLPGTKLFKWAKSSGKKGFGVLYKWFRKKSHIDSRGSIGSDFEYSANGYPVTDIYLQVSETNGLTWGPPVNVTNTSSDLCTPGYCMSETSLSAVPYSQDSLRLQYILDRDAGNASAQEGTWTNNPVKNLAFPIPDMQLYQSLSAEPPEFVYPFHTVPAGITDTSILLTNSGNQQAPYVASINYLSGSGWLAFGGTQGGTPSGSVPAGAMNTENIGLRATGPATEGFYQAEVKFTYNTPSEVITIPVDLYNFVRWTLPKDVSIRTSFARLNVNQASEIADNVTGRMFSYFSDTSDYIRDGYLIIGNSANNLSYSTFGGGGSTAGQPTISNPYGYLYAASDIMTSDSTTFGGYRFATGKGYNRDSTLEFTSDYFAPKHPDSGNFFVLRYSIYHGPKDTGVAVSGLTIAYYADIDVPSDTAVNNLGGFDTTLVGVTRRAILYQRGTLPTSPNNNQNRYLALGGAVHQGFAPIGGMVVPNPIYIHPEANWENDSLWNRLSLIPTGAANSGGRYSVDAPYADLFGGTGEDLSSTMLFYRGAQIRSVGRSDTLKITVIAAGTQRTGSFATLTSTMDRAYKFIRTNRIRFCRCGDADGNGAISISDAVKLINYIFAGGSAPNPLCRGDADGNGSISISDAVRLINYIFSGGAAPEKC